MANFTLKTLLDFAAAHQLHGYPGDCAKLHGHNWKVEVEVSGQKLNEIGMLIDFKEIKKAAKAVIKELDHTFLNDHPNFQDKNPTAENIAEFIFNELNKQLSTPTYKVSSITIWENDRNCVIYTE